MNRRGWWIPVMVVAINVFAILVRWSSLSELIPAHFDLQGNAGGTMPRNVLFLYQLIGAAICLVAYIIVRIKQTLETGFIILSSGVCLILLSSTMVSLTSGKHPVFMIAEPVILLLTTIAFIVWVAKCLKKNN
jgi:VIT1/CCC1 family predicted Fe2+/Mn2+ transporter